MSVSAAAIALGIIGSVAAAPVSGSKSPAAKPGAKPATDKKPAPPKLSKWQQHIQDMLRTSAPGDEYFGRMKMSYLGINNTFRDNLVRAGAYTIDPGLLSHIDFADDALTAWGRKYPNDPQLARSYFLAFQMYRKVWVQTYQDKAWQYAHIVIEKWPHSFFGKALQKDLSIGFTEHYFAAAVQCSDLVPIVDPSASATPRGRVQPTESPSPTPTPSPSPTPTPVPGGAKIEILPVPCLTPTPSPTPIPSPTPLPSFTPVPSGSLTPSPIPSGSASPSSSASPVVTASPSATTSPSVNATPTPKPSAVPSPTPVPTPVHTHRPH
jgi:hypothetical protein